LSGTEEFVTDYINIEHYTRLIGSVQTGQPADVTYWGETIAGTLMKIQTVSIPANEITCFDWRLCTHQFRISVKNNGTDDHFGVLFYMAVL
jgi:hypothetical protein